MSDKQQATSNVQIGDSDTNFPRSVRAAHGWAARLDFAIPKPERQVMCHRNFLTIILFCCLMVSFHSAGYSETTEGNNSDGFFNTALTYLQSGDYSHAKEYFERVIGLNPNDGEAYYHLSLACFRLQQFAQAIESYDKALTLNYPGDPQFAKWLEPLRNKTIPIDHASIFDGTHSIISIAGNPQGDNVLLNDVIGSIEKVWDVQKNKLFDEIAVETTSLGNGEWTEQWIVSGGGVSRTYPIEFQVTPQGGVDYHIQFTDGKIGGGSGGG